MTFGRFVFQIVGGLAAAFVIVLMADSAVRLTRELVKDE